MSSRMRVVVSLVLLAALAFPAFAQVTEVESEVVPGYLDKAQLGAEMRALNERLIAAEGKALLEAITVPVTDKDLQRLSDAPTDSGRLLVGVNKSLDKAIHFDSLDTALNRGEKSHQGGLLRQRVDGFLWLAKVSSPGATAMRLHFTDFSLPQGAELFVYNHLGQAFGPYTRRGVMQDGDFWTHTVVGDELRLQLRYEGENVPRALRATGLVITEVAHLGENFLLAKTLNPELSGGKAFCSFNASCIQNAECSSLPSAIAPAQNAVAHIQFAVGGSTFICTGGLVNDTDTSTTIPYFLTANHCLSTSSSASSLEAFFQFTTPCGGSCYNPDGAVPSVLGSTIKATSSNTDFTLLELNSSAPAGSTLLGWTTAAVANSNNTPLFRVSHPKGAPQAYSTQNVSTTAGTCGSLPRGNYIYSRDTFGATEGGSSGSPILNSSGQIVGQLFGACGTNLDNVCDSNSNATVDGAFAVTFSSISQFLDPGTGSCHTGNPGNANYCSASCPCDDGFGDCDNDNECASGTTCVDNVGPNYGYASWVDVCEAPSDCHVGAPGTANFCSNSCLCEDGEGDCDSDAQCVSGTTCVSNVGPNYGWASWVDVCEGQQSNPNSCVGNCGSQAPGGCWCDAQCVQFGDCCADKIQVCG